MSAEDAVAVAVDGDGFLEAEDLGLAVVRLACDVGGAFEDVGFESVEGFGGDGAELGVLGVGGEVGEGDHVVR